MQNPIFVSDYEKAKQEAKTFYDSIRRIWCPALNDYVIFHDVGFRHLIRKGSKRRPKSEQKRRFALIPYVSSIIGDMNVPVSHEERETTHLVKWQDEKQIITTDTDFWVFVAVRDSQKMKVVVRQFKGREKHFFGVYSKKQKPAQE
jgi:hypothetical protein